MSLRNALLAATCLAVACGGALRPAPSPAPAAVAPAPDPEPAPPKPELEEQLRQHAGLAPLLERAPTYRMQVLVSVPAPSGGWLRRDGYRVDAEYFYPASAIKLCQAVAALETVADLRERGPSQLDAGAGFVSANKRRAGIASVANLVNAAIVMSDNDASNDLFDLAGSDGLHERMWRIGLSTVRVRHRLGVGPGDDARSTPQITLLVGGVPVGIAPREGRLALGKNDDSGVRVGESHFAAGRLVEEPMSFEDKNRVSLRDLQELLVAVMRPELHDGALPRLGAEERSVLVEALSALPSGRGAKAALDAEHKPLLAGIERVAPRADLTIASKGGRAYGFVVENAYVADKRSGRAFFLAVALYTNANGRLNDDLYEYREVAFPALADLGEVVARSVFAPPN
ncbi:MAG: serine hydrolase [Labilithrix sp.]|nr:serine hydrolase [Labilithrix sp.]